MTDTIDDLQRRADALNAAGRSSEAVEAYRALLARAPDRADCWYNLGFLLRRRGEFDEALDAYAQALACDVSGPEEVHLNRAVIYADDLRDDVAAERELAAALTLAPDYAPALLNLGNLHEERGRQEEAAACYDRLVERRGEGGSHDAHYYEALARLAQLRPPAGPGDAALARIENAAKDAPLDDVTRANLWFALGRAHDRLENYDAAFAAFAEANRCARHTGRSYDRARMEAVVRAVIDAFPSADAATEAQDEKPAPLSICGMFRSGSTLIEQVLAGHDSVAAGGELELLPRLAAGPLAPFPASMASQTQERLAALAAEYRTHLARLAPHGAGGRYITDKRPENFWFIGLIKQLFPEARIIHTVRHPLDNGLSVYFQHLAQNAAAWSSDLADIGHYYGQYRLMMAHWKRLYPESVFDFDYDAFVRAPRPALARLLAFCGLDWSEDCLAFHARESTVKTASYWQVRRPLYGEASGRWRRYALHIDPLVAALHEARVDIPAD